MQCLHLFICCSALLCLVSKSSWLAHFSLNHYQSLDSEPLAWCPIQKTKQLWYSIPLKDTIATTGIRTCTQLISHTWAWVQCSNPLDKNTLWYQRVRNSFGNQVSDTMLNAMWVAMSLSTFIVQLLIWIALDYQYQVYDEISCKLVGHMPPLSHVSVPPSCSTDNK